MHRTVVFALIFAALTVLPYTSHRNDGKVLVDRGAATNR